MRIVEYLKHARKLFQQNSSHMNIVIGNSSGDMDSFISTIGFSYFEYMKTQKLIFPIISYSLSDLKLRRDIELVLKEAGIEQTDLIFINELQSSTNPVDDIYLVDHNDIDNDFLSQLVSKGCSQVKGIVDHHQDSQKYLSSSTLRIIRTCGSCSSLILSHEREYTQNLTEQERLLLCSAILLDTSNMKSKVESPDIEAMEILFGQSPDIQLSSRTGLLSCAKKDVSGFSCYDLIRKDYKQWSLENGTIVGIGSITHSLRSLDAGELATDIERFKKEHHVEVLVLMASFVDSGVFCRDFMWNSETIKLPSVIETELELGPEQSGISKQARVSWSRKQIAPLVIKTLNSAN